MSPSPRLFVPDIDDLSSVPDPLRRALFAAIDAYNAGIYTAAAVSGRRALEGIFKFRVDETDRNKPLGRLIEIVSRQDLAAPLRNLSHAIRKGGNLGAHFDMEHEPDEAAARQIVELLVYLVSYLYVLPTRIETLEAKLDRSPPDGSSSKVNEPAA